MKIGFVADQGFSIENPNVVVKSYPGFWDDLKKAGFIIKSI